MLIYKDILYRPDNPGVHSMLRPVLLIRVHRHMLWSARRIQIEDYQRTQSRFGRQIGAKGFVQISRPGFALLGLRDFFGNFFQAQ